MTIPLKYTITAEDKASAALRRARGEMESLGTSIHAVKGALAAVGVTVGAGALVALHLDAIQATAALGDMAQQAGASVEVLSAIQRVAKVGGHDFQGLTGQLGKMVSGLKTGGEEGNRATRAFEFLDIQVKDSEGSLRDTGQVLIELARKLQGYRGEGDKMALVQDALGRGAERYLPLLKDIAEGTDLVATTTRRQQEEAERAEKQLNRLKVSIEDASRGLALGLAPALADTIEELIEGTRIAGGFWNAMMMFGTTNPFRSLGGNITEVRREIERLTAERELMKGMPDYGGVLPGIESDLGTANARLEFLKFQQRQSAMRLATPDTLDARDLMARQGQEKRLGYRSDDGAGDRREAAFVAKQIQEGVEEEQRIQREAAAATSVFRDQQLAKEKAFLDARIQVLSENYDLEQELAIERSKELQESDPLSYGAKLDSMRQEFADKELLEEEAHARRIEQLQKFSNEELDVIGGRQAILLKMEGAHAERISQIRGAGDRRIFGMVNAMREGDLAGAAGYLADLTSGFAQHSRKMFELNKVAGISKAILNAHEGISLSLATYPWPWNIAAAAAHGALAFAQVSAISSTSFGGGGQGSAPSIAGSTPAPPVAPVESARNNADGQTTIIDLQGGDIFSEKQVRALVARINENTRNGGKIVVRRNGR